MARRTPMPGILPTTGTPPHRETVPLTEAQEGLWYLQHLDPANPMLNTGQYLDIRGPLIRAAFQYAVETAVGEAQSLRLRFLPDQPLQWLDPNLVTPVTLTDLRRDPNPQTRARALMQQDSDTPVDLTQGPLARFTLFILSDTHHWWYQRIHHLATDGFGMVLLTNRVAELYTAHTRAGQTARETQAPAAPHTLPTRVTEQGPSTATQTYLPPTQTHAPTRTNLTPSKTHTTATQWHLSPPQTHATTAAQPVPSAHPADITTRPALHTSTAPQTRATVQAVTPPSPTPIGAAAAAETAATRLRPDHRAMAEVTQGALETAPDAQTPSAPASPAPHPKGIPFPPLSRALQADAAYRTSPARQADRAYWQSRLANLPEVGSLSPGRPTPSASFHRETRYLPASTCDALRALATRAGTSWPDTLTALAAAWCQRFIATPEITVGIPFMARMGNPAARVPAMLMNVLPLRVMVNEDTPLPVWIASLARDMARDRRHGRYRSEQMRRDLGLIGGQRRLHGPLINVQPFDTAPTLPGLQTTLNILGAGAVDDLTLTFRGDAKTTLQFETDSNPALYTAEKTRRLSESFLAFLTAATDAQTLAEIPTATPRETHRHIHAANATHHPLPDTTLTALLTTALQATPDAPALRYNGTTTTYADVDHKTRALARHLHELGAAPGKLVATCLPRGPELVTALVAILRSGAAYLPLDPDHPPARTRAILDAAKPVAILGEGGLAPADWPPTPTAQPLPPTAPDDLAYVIYTSGSTGAPKGVMIDHRAIVNRLLWMKSQYGFTKTDRILQKTPATFDVSVWEFFLPLITGATLIIAPPGAHREPARIAQLIRDEQITALHFVPSMLQAFLADPASANLSPHRVFCSGEELSPDLRDRFHRRIRAELHNLYGPTEAAVDVSCWPAQPTDGPGPVPIGLPVWNTRLYVLDAKMRPLPPGIPGHLYLGGVQLARGYLNRPDLTAERFLPDPFLPGERIYATGDMARLREDGAVIYLGRSDHQVKIRGLRIELGEIEAAIMATGLARECVVLAREDRPGDRRLAAYLVPTQTPTETPTETPTQTPAETSAPTFTESALHAALAARLPDYMRPATLTALPELPTTANGKLDRAALPAPEIRTTGTTARTATETLLGGLFAEILNLPAPAGPQDDFFALGGDSLLALRLMLRLDETLGRDPGLGALFEHPTLQSLATLLDRQAAQNDGLAPLLLLADGDRTAPPLFLIHPAGGIAWGYRDLARALGRTRRIWGLQHPGLDPAHPLPDSLHALAAAYSTTITEIWPQPGAHLAGWSVGGILAQAVATCLQAENRAPGLTALIDSYPAECWRNEPEPDEGTALRALLAIAGHDPDAHRHLTTRADITTFLRKSGTALGQLPPPVLDGVIRVVTDTNRLVRGHHHRPLNGPLLHIRAAHDHKGTNLHSALWKPHATRVDQIALPFLHSQMTSPDASARLAPDLAARMSACGKSQRQGQ